MKAKFSTLCSVLKKLWCCVDGGNKVNSYINHVENVRVNARNVSFLTPYGGQFTFLNISSLISRSRNLALEKRLSREKLLIKTRRSIMSAVCYRIRSTPHPKCRNQKQSHLCRNGVGFAIKCGRLWGLEVIKYYNRVTPRQCDLFEQQTKGTYMLE